MPKITGKEDSPFGNTYGGLTLVTTDGGYYLEMGDCQGPDWFGPLTPDQVAAFRVLRDVQRVLKYSEFPVGSYYD